MPICHHVHQRNRPTTDISGGEALRRGQPNPSALVMSVPVHCGGYTLLR
jgi:hypothetical protein